MSPGRPPSGAQPRNGAGEGALTAGVVAVVLSLVPIVGDLLALPAVVLSVTLGGIGYLRAERGVATNPWQAIIGGLLGVVAAFIVFIGAAASGVFG